MGGQPSCQKLPQKSVKSTDGIVNKNKNRNKKPKKSSKNGKIRINKRETFRETTNPFIVFFLRLRRKKPHIPVTIIARVAGKLWSMMNDRQRKKYVDLANAEKRRRARIKKKRPKETEVLYSRNAKSRRKTNCRRK